MSYIRCLTICCCYFCNTLIIIGGNKKHEECTNENDYVITFTKPFSQSKAVHSLTWCSFLTHWGRVTHICVGKTTITGSDNGLSPGRRQAIIWTSAGILLIGPLGTNFSENLIEIQTFSLKKVHFKVSSAKWRPFWLGLNVLINVYRTMTVLIW